MPTLHLTDRAIKSLVSDEGVIDVRDTAFRGFGVRVTEQGTKSFFVMYPIAGRRKRLGLGRYPIVSLADARARARDALAQVARGEDPQEKKRISRVGTRLRDVVESFLTTYSKPQHSASWHSEVERICKKDIIPTLGNHHIRDITRAEIVGVLDRVSKRGGVSANRTRAVLSKLFSWALGRDLVATNPMVGVPRPSRERARERVLTPEEVRAVWHACATHPSLMAVTLQLVLITAQRGGEVRAMRWADIEDSWWTIPTSKSGHSHRVYLAPLAQELLATLDPETDYVFPNARGTGPMSRRHKTFVEIHDTAGIPHWTIHDLRRTATTMMTSMKISPFIVERILGHTDKRITAIYDRSSYDDEKREALEQWGARLETLISSP